MVSDETPQNENSSVPHMPADMKRRRAAASVVNLGIAANAMLAVLKLAAGIVGNSQALLADGVNSVSDVVYFIVVRIFVTFSAKPADTEHPYGHHQYESIAAVVVAAFVITSGLAIFWQSVNSAFDILTTDTQGAPIQRFTLWVALFTVVLKIVLMVHARRISSRTSNIALSAIARDHRNDIYASAGAAMGIVFSLFGFAWVDPLAGAIVAVLVTKTGIDILRESSAELMDTVPGEELGRVVREELSGVKGVKQVESVHAHRFGPYLVMNVTVGVEGSLSVSEGDNIADRVEEKLLESVDMLKTVYVHYHPAEKRDG